MNVSREFNGSLLFLTMKLQNNLTTGRGLWIYMEENEQVSKIYSKKFNKQTLKSFISIISGNGVLNRKKALSKNRKNRWSKETREKYAAIKRAALAEKEKELLSQNII